MYCRSAKRAGKLSGELRDGLVRRARHFDGVELAIGVEIEGYARGDRAHRLGINMADDGNQGAGLFGGLQLIATRGEESCDAVGGGTHGQLALDYLLNGFELGVVNAERFL